MKKRVLGITAGTILLFSCADEPTLSPQDDLKERQKAWTEHVKEKAASVYPKIMYMKDPRTGLCFAYLWEEKGRMNGIYGGPGFTWVPCDSVPRRLLVVPKQP
jgi:hypothetical protein